MPLSNSEIRDITRLLEAGEPLPDKYRFMLFGDDREIELVWNGKTGNVTNVVMPFQTIEHIDEPRSEKELKAQPDLFDFGTGRQLKGWTNKLIWGDNKLILSSLKNGPLREEIEEQGGIKLIYIDPPFDVGANFHMEVEVGESTFEKEASVLEEVAYRDTWGKGQDSFLSMLHERISLLHNLMSNDGVFCLHIGPRVSHLVKLICDEIFGEENLINEVIWRRRLGQSNANRKIMGIVNESIFIYSKSDKYQYNPQYSKKDADDYIRERYTKFNEKGRQYKPGDLGNPSYRPNLIYDYKGHKPPKNGWAVSLETMKRMDDEGRLEFPKKPGGRLMRRQFLDEWKGKPIQSLWADLPPINSQASERLGYDNQKPERLIQRLLEMFSSNEDLVCDFFVGSGTTAAVAEKLGRKWICTDLGKFSIHTSRKRLIGVQRLLKEENKNYRAFEILNLGKYERSYFVTANDGLNPEQKSKDKISRELAFNDLILQAYNAELIDNFRTFRGKKNNRLIAIGPVNLPVARPYVEEVIAECLEKGITKADLLAFEFEMGLFPNVQDNAKEKGVDLVLKYIPKDVFDKRAVESGEVDFHDVAYIEVRPHHKKNSLAVELTDYAVFYTQGSAAATENNLKDGKSAVVVDNGVVLRVSKHKTGLVQAREVLTKDWSDWIDYWSVDYDFESKKEIIRIKNEETGEFEEKWTGDYIFENQWQSFRTRQDRSLKLTSAFHECQPGLRKIAVKVIDIFGNDTMKVIPVTVGATS
jgi:adenine-specific DNA-methyltransferase